MSEATNNPSYECAAYANQMPDYNLVNDCYAGTRVIRDKSTEYLPQEPAEKIENYAVRLARAVFWNAFRRTVQGLVGMVFRKNPQVAEDVAPVITDHLENIDLQGTHFDVFSKQVFTDQVKDGHTFVLIDMPPPLEDGATRADEVDRRPYWIQYKKNQIINWRTEQREGAIILTQVTLRECVSEPDGEYGESEVVQYRVLRPGSWTVYREDESGNFNEYASGLTSLDFIPLVEFNGSRTGYFQSSPRLLAVAYENLRLYRLQSDLEHVMHICNVPIFVITGRANSKDPIIISVNMALDLPVGGTADWTEHQGHAIPAAQAEIEVSKGNMAALGLSMLVKRSRIVQTATQSTIDYDAESSELASEARSLEDGLEQCIVFHSRYLQIEPPKPRNRQKQEGGSVTVNKDFSSIVFDSTLITAFSNMVTANQIRLETLWDLLERGDMLPPNFDPKIEKAAIDASTSATQDYNAQMLEKLRATKAMGPNGNPPPNVPDNPPTVQ